MKLIACLTQDPCGRFSASVPCLDGAFSCGDTVEEALHNITEATDLFLEVTWEELEEDNQMVFPELPEDFFEDGDDGNSEYVQAVLHNFVELSKAVKKKLNSKKCGHSSNHRLDIYKQVKVTA